MTSSMTRSSTFTYTDAKYVASKLGADLLGLNARYGFPSRPDVEAYVEEVALHLQHGYLEKVDFGFQDGERWVLRLSYTAASGGQLRDETPGGLPSAYDIAGHAFCSYLTRSSAYRALTEIQRAEFERISPVCRTPGIEPTANAGSFSGASQYSRSGNGISRNVYTAF